MMANNAVKTPILRAIASRSYCSHASNPISGTINEIKSSVLPNKLVVCSAETGSPISRLSVIFRAGARYEASENAGVSHVLRITAGLSTKNASQFAITRQIQQVGASLTCVTDRETIAYTLTGTYQAVKTGSEFLCEIATNQIFKPWEVADSMPRLKLELASLSPEIRTINFLHKAAYRGGLGNSMFCPKHKVGKISTETLQHYVAHNFGASKAAVVGLGIEHTELVAYAKNMQMEAGSEGDDSASKYHGGGEIRSEKGGDLAYVALATEGGTCKVSKEAIAFAVLQRALGTSSYVKWGTESSSMLNKAVAKDVGDAPFGVSAFNCNYSDSGLFGIFAIAPARVASQVVTNAYHVLKQGHISEKDVHRAKNQLKLATLLEMEHGESCISSLGYQAVFTATARTPQQWIAEIDAITANDVNKAAQKVAAGKLSMAAVGNLECVPYLDQLK